MQKTHAEAGCVKAALTLKFLNFFSIFFQIEKLWSTMGDRPAEAVELAWEQLELCQRQNFHAGLSLIGSIQ